MEGAKKYWIATAIGALFLLVASPASAGWAIAFSPSTGEISGYGMAGESAKARKSALADCSKKADDCEIVGSGWNGCHAFAVRGRNWAIGEGKNVQAAISDAEQQCKAKAGGTCETKLNFCDGSGGFRPVYDTCGDEWQAVMKEHGRRSEEAQAVCIKLNVELARQNKGPCICK